MKRSLTFIAGVILIILGIAGLVLPILQGILFITIGIALISPEYGEKMIKKFKKWKNSPKKKR